MNIKRINELDYINNPEGYYGICSDGDGNTKRYKISISEGGEGGNQDKLDKLVNITYSELVNLRDNGELIPGQQYRITNYITTTNQFDTQSAGHQFDVIVTADDINVLNENARAIQHEGDAYFANSDLNAWELKYCLDNDIDRFAWADAETYVEIRLEVDDFLKNQISVYTIDSQIPDVLKFSWWGSPRNGTEDFGADVYSCDNLQLAADDILCLAYPLGTDVIANPELCYPNICLNGQPTEITLEYDNDGDGIIDKKYIPTSIGFSNGKGVIYFMKDEFNNECPYDFKNIQFARWELSNPVGYRNDYYDNYENNWIQVSKLFDSLKTGFYGLDGSKKTFYYGNVSHMGYNRYKVEYTISESPTYCYTFGKDTDYSINGSNYDNVIKEYKDNKILLNNIVFLGDKCYSNSFSNNCYDNTFGNNCYDNSFGNSCSSNSFGNDCYDNSFGNSCCRNSFGISCYRNSFGIYCNSNCFGHRCYQSSFGIYCNSNCFGNECSNSFGDNCSSNSFGNSCYRNSFGNSCSSNSFGNGCWDNSFGNSCGSNSFGNSCSSNSFGNDCYINSFGESSTNPKSYYRYIIFDNGNSNINLNCTSTTSSINYYQNVRIGLGVNDTYTDKTINDSNVGQTYQTTYKPADSKDLTA